MDVGGTFSDAIVLDAQGRLGMGKAPTTPQDLAVGIMGAIDAAARSIGVPSSEVMEGCRLFCNGTTVCTNAMIQGRGAVTGLITTRGFEDTLVIGRVKALTVGLDEAQLINFQHLDKPPPVVPFSLSRGVTERVDFRGKVLCPLDQEEVNNALHDLTARGVEALAVCLLWSCSNPEHERAIGDIVRDNYPGIFVTLSSEVAPVMGEYERANTTAVNSFLGPVLTSVCLYLCNDIPWNAGILKVTRVLAPEGSLVHARFPAPVGAGVVNASWYGRNVCSLALAKMLACSQKYRENLVANTVGSSFVYNIFGTSQYGKPFGTMMLSSTLGGGGARYFADGYDTCGPTPASRSSVINVEEAEALFPLLYLYRKRAVDSGGPGKFRGGVAAESAITPYNTTSIRTVVSTQATGHSSSQGVEGGYPGGSSNALLKVGTNVWATLESGRLAGNIEELAGEPRFLPSKDVIELRHGDVLSTVGHGGGGFGDPLERDPALVQRDVINGFVSGENARHIYGVALHPDTAEVVPAATRDLRADLKRKRLSPGQHMPRQNVLGTGTPDASQRLGDNLYIFGDGVFCRRCHHELGDARENPKAHCLVARYPLSRAGPWLARRHQGDSPLFRLREYVCPGCGALLFVEERLEADLEPWPDYRLYGA